MTALACSGCGAPLQLPADLAALEAGCEFCTVRTTLPADLAAVRLRELEDAAAAKSAEAKRLEVAVTTRKVKSYVMWIVIISLAFPILLTGAILGFTAYMTTRVTRMATTHTSHGH